MPLVIAAVSILTTFLLVLGLTYLTDVSFVVQFLIALVGLGVAIDYSLLLVSRWREERAHGRSNDEAVVRAVQTAGHAVLASGVTVAISLLALVVVPVPFLRSMGLGGMLIPLVSVAVVLTLLPALLSKVGPRVDWPRIRHDDVAARGWSAWAPATAPVTVLDQQYCYQAGTTPTGGCTASPSADRSNIQWMKNNHAGEASSYSYDDHNRLTKDVLTGGTNPRTYTFSYDPAGNRLAAVSTGTSPTSQSLGFNAGNQISSAGYGYDGAGNRSTGDAITATYNTAGHMTATTKNGSTTNYGYAGTSSNELLSETTTGGDTYGRADQNGLPGIEEVAYTHAGTTANAYVAHDNTGLPVLLTTSTGSACMYVYDGHNNPAGLVTNFGSLAYLLNFDPYGGTTVAQNSGGSGYVDNPYGYAGGIGSHTTPLIKFGARWYDPTTGTWTQQDTHNTPLDPHNGNRYIYAADNPINNSEPSGNNGFSDFVSEAFATPLDAVGTVVELGVGCLSGLAAVDESGVGEAATLLAGPVGGVAANVAGCAVGAGTSVAGGDGALG